MAITVLIVLCSGNLFHKPYIHKKKELRKDYNRINE